MSFTEINGKQVQAESLEGIERIRIECAEMDLVIEGDAELNGVVHLVTQASSSGRDRMPVIQRRGPELLLYQLGRYRQSGSGRPVLRLPVQGCPPLEGSIEKGDLKVALVSASLDLKHGLGNINIERGDGDLALDSAKGDVSVREWTGAVSLHGGSGNVHVQRCDGPLAISVGRGDIHTSECGTRLVVKQGSGNLHVQNGSGDLIVRGGSGDITVQRPRDMRISANLGSGDIRIRDGSVGALALRIARGDITCSARLSAHDDLDDVDDEVIDTRSLEDEVSRLVSDVMSREEIIRSIENAVRGSMKSAHMHLHDFEFQAGDDGVRIMRGGKPIFEADPSGVRFRKGTFAFEAGDTGVRIKRGSGSAGDRSARPGVYELEVTSGDISLEVPYGAPIRIEALVTSGDVRSDIPLVTVGRPGPRGSTQRYVGGTNPNEGTRMSVRLRSERGDIRVRAVSQVIVPPPPPVSPAPPSPPEPPAPPMSGFVDSSAAAASAAAPRTEREERMQSILGALASGSIGVSEAERLLEALERSQSQDRDQEQDAEEDATQPDQERE